MPDESTKFAADPDLFKIMMLIGAVMGIGSVFLAWFSLDMLVARFEYNGFDFYLKGLDLPDGYPSAGYYAYMPLAVFAAAAISVIPAALSFTKRGKNGAAAATVLGAVMLAATLLYIFYPMSKMALISSGADLIADIRLMDYLGAGVYLAVIASMLLIIGGAIVMLRNKADAGVQKSE
ncbi:MAG: hypothetical protein FWG96_03805 [Methanomassiliicoccaceae archaeon]|nr:hypothetical protein [Methanomassiliicoccaceae archaeon]